MNRLRQTLAALTICFLLASLATAKASDGGVEMTIAQFVSTYENTTGGELPTGRIAFLDTNTEAWGSSAMTEGSLAKRLCAILQKMNELNDGDRNVAIYMPNLREGSLPEYAFMECQRVHYFEAPLATGGIGSGAFAGCTGLVAISVPQMQGEVGSAAFTRCSLLVSVDMPRMAWALPMMAFSYCESLETLSLPSCVGHIGNGAFVGCTKLKTVNLPKAGEGLGAGIFEECPALTTITLSGVGATDPGTVDPDCFQGLNTAQCSLTFTATPHGEIYNGEVWKIGSNAHVFRSIQCPTAETSAVPVGMTTRAFAERYQNTDAADLPQGVIIFTDTDNRFWEDNEETQGLASELRRILQRLNTVDGAAVSISMPNFTGDIPMYAFQDCHALVSYSAPKATGTIFHFAFDRCSKLKSLELGAVSDPVGSVFGSETDTEAIDLIFHGNPRSLVYPDQQKWTWTYINERGSETFQLYVFRSITVKNTTPNSMESTLKE